MCIIKLKKHYKCVLHYRNFKNSVIFPPEISKKTIHNAYLEYLRISAPPDEKTMGYSTFRHFMKEQFPHVRFCKVELGMFMSS